VAEGEIPQAIEYMLDHIDLVKAPDEGNPVVKATYDRMENRQCMLCGGHLGEETMIAVNRYGVFVMVCGGACFTDLPVLHWIQEQHEEMNEQIRFRGGEILPDAADDPSDPRGE